MKKALILKLFICMAMLMLIMGCASTQGDRQASDATVSPSLTSIQVEDNTLVIKSNQHFTYAIYKSSDPYRATIEIPDMTTGQFTDKISSERAGITEIIPQQIESPRLITKLDIVLQNPSSLTPSYKDNTLTVAVAKNEPVLLTSEHESEPEQKAAVRLAVEETAIEKVQPQQEIAPAKAKATEIKNIEIKKTADTVKVLVTGNGTMIPNVFPINERIVVDIPDVALRASIPSKTFSPLKGIRAGKHQDKLRLVLDLKEKTNFDVTAIGDSIEITLTSKETASPQPASLAAGNGTASSASVVAESPAQKTSPAPEPITEGVYTGKKISLDFQDADIVPIFRLLGDISGYNMVVNPDVKGKVTLKLVNVPWDQALDIILRTFSLAKIVDGNIIRIVPNTVVAKELDDMTRAKKAAAEAGDLRTRIFAVNYAELGKLKDSIDKAKLLSSRGSISIDERGSSIIVNDLEVNIEKIAELIKDIDQEVMQARQVMIEAKIVEVNVNYAKELGIQWGTFYKTPGDNSYTIGRTSTGSPNNFLVNLPAATGIGTGGAIGFGYISKAANFTLDLQISALEATRNGKVLSNPKIMTMNNQEAKITQGRTIYLPVATSDKTDYKAIDALLSLTVKPRIAPGGAVFMDLDITKDEPGVPTAGGVDVLKNTVKTSVLVNNSDTVVIGGIFKTTVNATVDGVPGLSRLPLLGRLFKRDTDRTETTELMVFITPTIVNFSALR
jgi:type IV pilus assembly protein PilQ